ncbi:hypothetical protein PCH_Pc21g21480 [Penicillium rubens Wisconsin 54-1255]|uniref:Uncharacterized protein n=1 Tax=Penicillium rubens (strain ATCC 28089 / DSM 1075 / NRRL 1951 / Wisconsin 54-1255) TaxID=500485 RepID=B6HLV0_PENRW|nr:hypothetical protein PCH_Pc21g21480 [Penicillium rubens Wisconsin 54-1255]
MEAPRANECYAVGEKTSSPPGDDIKENVYPDPIYGAIWTYFDHDQQQSQSTPSSPHHSFRELRRAISTSSMRPSTRSVFESSIFFPAFERVKDRGLRGSTSGGIDRVPDYWANRALIAPWARCYVIRLMPGFPGHYLLAILASFHLSENPSLPSSLSPLLALPDHEGNKSEKNRGKPVISHGIHAAPSGPNLAGKRKEQQAEDGGRGTVRRPSWESPPYS